MVAPIIYHSLVAKFQSFEQLRKHRGMQGGVARQRGGDTRIVPLTSLLRQPVEDTRVYGEAARQRDRGKETRSLSALLGRAKVAMKGRENLRDFEDEDGTIR